MGTPQHTHFVLPLVRGFPRQCHGSCCLTIPHAWTPLFQCIFTSYFCLGLDNHLSLSPKEQTWIQATGLSRFCVMVTMLYAVSLLFSHGWGLVTESGSFAQSFFSFGSWQNNTGFIEWVVWELEKFVRIGTIYFLSIWLDLTIEAVWT